MCEKVLLCWGKHMYCYNVLVILLFLFTFYSCFLKSIGQDRQHSEIEGSFYWNIVSLTFLFIKVYLVPKTGDPSNDKHKKLFEALMQKNFSQYSENEIGFFTSFKESQYSARRNRVEHHCQVRDQNFGRKIIKNSLVYDPKDKVSYCHIAKVASSTWSNHFIKLGKIFLDILILW